MSTINEQNNPHKIRYPQSFKITVVSEVLTGQISQNAALRKYKIGGKSTIAKWIRKYSESSQIGKYKKADMADNKNKIKLLKDRVHQLEGLVSDLELEKKMLNKIIEIAEKEYHISIKKNFGPKQSNNLPEKKEE